MNSLICTTHKSYPNRTEGIDDWVVSPVEETTTIKYDQFRRGPKVINHNWSILGSSSYNFVNEQRPYDFLILSNCTIIMHGRSQDFHKEGMLIFLKCRFPKRPFSECQFPEKPISSKSFGTHYCHNYTFLGGERTSHTICTVLYLSFTLFDMFGNMCLMKNNRISPSFDCLSFFLVHELHS